MMKRNASVIALIVFLWSCTNTSDLPVSSSASDLSTYHVSVEDEAAILAMEDRRHLDQDLVAEWIAHPSPHYRSRLALAMGRVGAASFADSNGNGFLDEGERPAGAVELERLSSDPDHRVVRAAVFALGEIDSDASSDLLTSIALDPSAHGAVRAAAVESLSKLGEDVVDSASWLRLMAEDQPDGIRVAAIRYAFRLNDNDEVFSRVASYLAEDVREIREAAAYAHSRRANPEAAESLRRLMTDRDDVIRSYAVRALDRIADDADLDLFLEALGDQHPWVRTNAVRAITSVFNRNPSVIKEAGSADLTVRLLTSTKDPDPGTKALAIEALGPLAPSQAAAKARLEELLVAPEWWFREQAALALAREDLLDAAALTNRGMRLSVARGAGADLSDSLRAVLIEDEDPSVRAAIIGSIPNDQTESRQQTLLSLLDDEDALVRGAALDRLEAAGVDDELIERVRALEKQWRFEPQNDARLAAIGFLVEHDLVGREALLREFVEDSDPVVRRFSADAFENTLEQPRPQFTPLPVRHTVEDYLEIAQWSRQSHTASIRTVRGNIDIALLTSEAPMTTWNFAKLAESGYFDESSFMRVVPNFVIQGGDPRRDMTGGPGWAIRDEINQQHYTRGAVGMALSGPDTGGSQFFVTHSPQYHLDGGYTIFGRVIDGMNGSVDQMHRDDTVLTIEIDAVPDNQEEVAKSARYPLPLEIGEISRETLESRVDGYQLGAESYEPDPDVLSMLSMMLTPEHSITVVLGTWCRDSQREVPRFFSIMESLSENYGIDVDTRYIAVDRTKHEPAELIENFGIESVATFIVKLGDQELGRIVETPRSLLEDDLMAILAGAQ